MNADYRVGDYGNPIRVTLVDRQTGLPHDLTSYTAITYVFTAPDGTRTTKTGSAFDAVNGVATYTVDSGLLSQAGTWKYDVQLTKTGMQVTSTRGEFTVEAAQ